MKRNDRAVEKRGLRWTFKCVFFSAKSFSTATKLSHITCFSWRATLDILVVFSVWGRLFSLTYPGQPKKSCRFLVDSFDCVLSQKPLFSPHQTVKACLHKRRDAAPSATSRVDSLRRCLKVNAVNSIYSSSAPLFFVLSPTQPPKPLHPFLPLFPLSLSPTSFNLFYPFFPLRILPALFSSSPLSIRHPPPATRLHVHDCLERSLSPDFGLAGCISHRPPAYLLSLHCETNQWCVCARVSASLRVRVHVVTDPVFSTMTARLLAARKPSLGAFALNLKLHKLRMKVEIMPIEKKSTICCKKHFYSCMRWYFGWLKNGIFLKTVMEIFFFCIAQVTWSVYQ